MTVVADHGDLGRGAVFHHIEQGDDGVGGEVNMAQSLAGLVQRRPERQFDEL
jgi:hypothetical protein